MSSAKVKADYVKNIVIIGAYSVGKTCLLQTLVGKPFSTSYVTTIGVDCSVYYKEQKGKKIKLVLWDTAGQERFDCITASLPFVRQAHAIMLVYDVNDKESLSQSIEMYKKIIDKSGRDYSDIPKLLIGTKSDLEINIPEYIGDHHSKIIEAKHYITSSITKEKHEQILDDVVTAMIFDHNKLLDESKHEDRDKRENYDIDLYKPKSSSEKCCIIL